MDVEYSITSQGVREPGPQPCGKLSVIKLYIQHTQYLSNFLQRNVKLKSTCLFI